MATVRDVCLERGGDGAAGCLSLLEQLQVCKHVPPYLNTTVVGVRSLHAPNARLAQRAPRPAPRPSPSMPTRRPTLLPSVLRRPAATRPPPTRDRLCRGPTHPRAAGAVGARPCRLPVWCPGDCGPGDRAPGALLLLGAQPACHHRHQTRCGVGVQYALRTNTARSVTECMAGAAAGQGGVAACTAGCGGVHAQGGRPGSAGACSGTCHWHDTYGWVVGSLLACEVHDVCLPHGVVVAWR